jgi:hypothetical protein
MKLILLIICATIATLNSSAALGAVTFSDIGGTQRPTNVTGLDVNGVSYDVTITYNIPINRATTVLIGALPDSDANQAAFDLRDAVNAAATADSNETIVYLLSNTQPVSGTNALSLASINDESAGVGDFLALLSNTFVTSIARPARGSASFSLAVMSASSVQRPRAVVHPDLHHDGALFTAAKKAALGATDVMSGRFRADYRGLTRTPARHCIRHWVYDGFLVCRCVRANGMISSAALSNRNTTDIGLVTSGSQLPPELIRPAHRFFSATGPSTNPMTNGASGMVQRSN